MREMEVEPATALTWFPKAGGEPYTLIKVLPGISAEWPQGLAAAFRRAYISDKKISDMAALRKRQPSEILGAVLPPPGSVMAGDFGEILVYLLQGSSYSPQNLYGQKKWRLKETRTHAAPYSDVVHFHLPDWPMASSADVLLCSEVKMKSTPSKGDPIADARHDSKKDRVSRLAKTLVWLKERAMTDPEIEVEPIERFLSATEGPAYAKQFQAVAVVDEEYLDAELAKIVLPHDQDCDLVVITIQTLHATYTAVYEACIASAQKI